MRRSDLMLAGGLTLVVGLTVGNVLLPALRARIRTVHEIERLRAEHARPFNGPEVVERLSADLRTLRVFGEGRMTPIPEDSDIAGLMGSLGRTLSDLKLEQRDITMRQARALDGASVMPVAVTIYGPFQRIYQAIGAIESLPRLVRVGRLRVVSNESGGVKRSADGEVKAELTIDAFYSPTTITGKSPGDVGDAGGATR